MTADELKQIITDLKGAGVRTLKGEWKDSHGEPVVLDVAFERGPPVTVSAARRRRTSMEDES